jgi:hypothetical protein
MRKLIQRSCGIVKNEEENEKATTGNGGGGRNREQDHNITYTENEGQIVPPKMEKCEIVLTVSSTTRSIPRCDNESIKCE